MDQQEWGEEFKQTVLRAYSRFSTINIFVVRNLAATYQTTGRKEDYEAAQKLDRDMTDFLRQYGINHLLLDDNNAAAVLAYTLDFVLGHHMAAAGAVRGQEGVSKNAEGSCGSGFSTEAYSSKN
jgi:hypothetical protein